MTLHESKGWLPLASVSTLKQKDTFIRGIRAFLYERGYMEVDVPVLGEHGVTDPNIEALHLGTGPNRKYLQTSPEYFMKRLLAAGSGDIFYLGKAFRSEELGRFHHHEFTMLEWYRCGFDDKALMSEVSALILTLKPELSFQKFSYRSLFESRFGANPHILSVEVLREIIAENMELSFHVEDKSTALDLIFSHLIEPQLPSGLVAVFDYPVCQAALARIDQSDAGDEIARRFEFFLDGVELANGYFELTDWREQQTRFEQDNAVRIARGKPSMTPDPHLLEALKAGLPSCAGVALGVDRLIMRLIELDEIAKQRSF